MKYAMIRPVRFILVIFNVIKRPDIGLKSDKIAVIYL